MTNSQNTKRIETTKIRKSPLRKPCSEALNTSCRKSWRCVFLCGKVTKKLGKQLKVCGQFSGSKVMWFRDVWGLGFGIYGV